MGEFAESDSEVVLRLSGITKRFGGLVANDGVGFALHRGELLALLGENGAGKTTLMNIVFGHYMADDGEVDVFGRCLPPGSTRAAIAAGIGMVHQHFTLADNLTVLDNIVLGTESLWRWRTDRGVARSKIKQLALEFGLAVNLDARVGDLSVGERQRVEILKVLYRDARILILDEPTATLTPQETTSLFDTLKKLSFQGLSVIFISHKLYEVLAVSRRILVLRGGGLVAERFANETDRHELAGLMVGREIPEPKVEPQPPGPPRLEMIGVSVADKEKGRLLDDVDLVVRDGEIVGIAGVAGNGQGVLSDVLSGLIEPTAGTVRLSGKEIANWTCAAAVARGIGRIPEDGHTVALIGDMSVVENAIGETYRRPEFCSGGIINWKVARGFAQKIMAAYDVRCPSAEISVRLLSGGNMQKLILGRALSHEPSFVLANQISRGLDIGAVDYVHRQLLSVRRAGGAVLLISEDLDELLALADRIIVMYRGHVSAPVPRAEVSIERLGQMMAGHGFKDSVGGVAYAA